MATYLDDETLPVQFRVAVTPHPQGIAVFRGSPEGLHCRVSPDGLMWTGQAVPSPAGPLRPICAVDRSGKWALLCEDVEGRMLLVHADLVQINAQIEYLPVPSPKEWYDTAPKPRDLAVVRDEVNNVYRAFFGARRSAGHKPEHRGCIGLAISDSLGRWEIQPPALAPNRYSDLSATHAFCDEARSVLFYSTPEEDGLRAIRFALSPSPAGPYKHTYDDMISHDVRSNIHTVALGSKRLALFGRTVPNEAIPSGLSRPGELVFRPDGRPYVRLYDRMLGLLGRPLFETSSTLNSGEMFVRVLPQHALDFRFSANLQDKGAQAVGFVFRTTPTGSDNVSLWLEFETDNITLRRGVRGRILGRTKHPLGRGKDHHVAIWAEGNFADVYINDEWVLTGSTESRRSGGFGLVVEGGEAFFGDVSAQPIQAS